MSRMRIINIIGVLMIQCEVNVTRGRRAGGGGDKSTPCSTPIPPGKYIDTLRRLAASHI